jgi:hypothetical protein
MAVSECVVASYEHRMQIKVYSLVVLDNIMSNNEAFNVSETQKYNIQMFNIIFELIKCYFYVLYDGGQLFCIGPTS